MPNNVKIYTDGSCMQIASSSGEGAFASILIFEDNEIELSGYEEETTNNRMEMMAAIVALEYLKESYNIEIYSDSAYLVECFNKRWFEKWIKNNWNKSDGKAVANKDLWIRLMSSFKGHHIKFIKVKGHSDNEYNNRCDEIAKKVLKENQKIK